MISSGCARLLTALIGLALIVIGLTVMIFANPLLNFWQSLTGGTLLIFGAILILLAVFVSGNGE